MPNRYQILGMGLNLLPMQRLRGRAFGEVFSRWHRDSKDVDVKLPIGSTMTVDVAELIGFSLACVGEYEPDLCQFVAKTLRPGDTFVDIGGHFGLFTLVGAKAVGPQGQVHSFEPGIKQRRLLEKNVAQNALAHVRVNALAVGEHTGRARFIEGPAGNLGMSKVVMETGSAARPELIAKAAAGPVVDMISLDDYCAQNNIARVDAIKIDVEGAEVGVFAGGQRTLTKSPPRFIAYECVDSLAKDFGTSANQTHELLRSFGYTLYQFVHGQLTEPGAATAPVADWIAVHSSAKL
jgi:FkbM family methyltransferase